MALATPMVMAAVLAVAWALPLAWWSIATTFAILTGAIAIVLHATRSSGWRGLVGAAPTHAAWCLWIIGAIGLAYATRALGNPTGDRFTRLGYPFLVQTGLALQGGELLLLLIAVVAAIPTVFSAPDRSNRAAHRSDF
jgi:hypothetical protein